MAFSLRFYLKLALKAYMFSWISVNLESILVLCCLMWLLWEINIWLFMLLRNPQTGLYHHTRLYVLAVMHMNISVHCGNVRRISQMPLEALKLLKAGAPPGLSWTSQLDVLSLLCSVPLSGQSELDTDFRCLLLSVGSVRATLAPLSN